LVCDATRSSRWVLTSVPMPKEKTLVLATLDRETDSTSLSSFVSPIVGWPSVRKMTT
jgi:hypothetical protein